MSQAILERIEEIFDNPEGISMENVEIIVKEMLGFFDLIRLKLASEKTEEREEALALAVSLKETLESKAKTICAKMGVDQGMLEHYISNPFNFSKEEWQTMSNTKEQFETYREEVTENIPPKVPSTKRVTFPKKAGFKKI